MLTTRLLTTLACLAPSLAAADTVALQGGGRVAGQVVKDPSAPRGAVVLQTEHGRLVLDRSRVARVNTESPAESEYRQRAPSVSDTVDAQFALAGWCRNNGLSDAMRRHLARVLELAPDHSEARALLGYQQVDGAWMTRDDVLAARGLILWEGEYRTRQEVALLKRKDQIEEAQRAWRQRLADWRADLDHPDRERVRQAEDAFDALSDPAATAELVKLLADEQRPHVRRRLARVAGRLATPAALATLAQITMNDADGEMRAIALEELAESGSPGLASPFVAALRSNDNRLVNRAGEALALLGSQSAVEPLVDALVTTHRFRVGNESGGDSYSLNSASGTFGFGGGKARTVERTVQNPNVLATLVRLTGVNFQYDQPAWKAWLAGQQVDVAVDLRRDL